MGKAIGNRKGGVILGQVDHPKGDPKAMFSRWRQLLQRARGQEGSAAVEFAIILPLLVLLTIGALDLGHMFYIDHLITTASREGARYAAKYTGTATEPSSGQISNYVKLASGLNYDAYNLDTLTVTTVYAGTFPNRIATVTVTAIKNWWLLGNLLSFSPKTLTATSAMNVEH
jgi:Flp pilus assembly protein TadG